MLHCQYGRSPNKNLILVIGDCVLLASRKFGSDPRIDHAGPSRYLVQGHTPSASNKLGAGAEHLKRFRIRSVSWTHSIQNRF